LGVRIPDLPGCHGGGATAEAALADAISAVREWAEHRRVAGLGLPFPRKLAEIGVTESIDASAGEMAVVVPVLPDAGRTVRANVTFDAGLLAAIDTEAGRRGLTRSAFLASAAREKIEARR
jgi:predicted RNase H-like HicB family nuclease